MAKIVRLTESQLKGLINKVIAEQDLAVRQNFQQGAQSNFTSGQQSKQAVNQALNSAAKAGKQVVIKLGNTVITVITIGAAVVWLIGKGIWKVSATVGNALLKLLTATGKVVVGAATSLANSTVTAMKNAGVALSEDMKLVNQKLASLKDSSITVAKWLIGQAKQLGTKAWAKILAGASALAGVGQQINEWLKSQWSTIANAVGVQWDQAKSMATGALKSAGQAISNTAKKAGQAISNTANDIRTGATNFANKAANYAGKAAGWLSGFLSELFNRFVSFKGEDMMSILSESRQYNGKEIVL